MSIAYINGNIQTINNHKVVQAMLVENGVITDIGTNDKILDKEPKQVVDLNNKTVIPGINDSHLHALLSCEKMEQIDVSGAMSITEMIEQAKKEFPTDLKVDTWVIGRGWNQDYFDTKQFPTKDDLDKISTDYPIIMIRACIHICVVNTKALEIINLDKNNLPILKDGKIYLNDNGELNGLFSESALTYVYKHLPTKSLDDIKEMILKFQKHLNSEGITSIHTDDFTALNNVEYKQIIKAYQDLASDDLLTIKVYQQCLLPKDKILNDFLNKGYHTKQDFGYYRLGPLKLLLDGSLGARTAVIEGNYYDRPDSNGISVYNDEELYELGKIAQLNNLQMAIHGIGDGAINQIIRLYEKINNDLYKDDTRHGIVHCQITNEEMINKIAKQKIVVYAQPIFLHYDIHIVDGRVGTQKAKTSYAFNTLKNKGVSVSYGTDSPVEPTNPFNNIYCAITRKDLSKTLKNSWNQHECVNIYDAIKAYTYESAYQSFEEESKGTLEVGKVADFIVLNQDIFNVPIDDITKTKVLKTFVNGQLVYDINEK